MMAAPLVGREELSHETNLREGCKNVWTKLCKVGGKSRGSKGGQNHRTSRTLRCPPLGASWRPQQHAGLCLKPQSGARTRARVPATCSSKPPTRLCDPAHKQCQDIADAKAPTVSDLRNIANDTMHAHAVNGERIRRRARERWSEVAPR